MQMYCNNCGLRGHVFRDCQDPVVSCGIVLVRGGRNLPIDPQNAELLMIRRKDSMSYTEFLRGKYHPEDSGYLFSLLENMTQGEQDLVRSYPFDTLWSKLWGYGVDHHSNEYPHAKQRFESQPIASLLDAHRTPYVESEWGFPKGRRIRCESDIECAIREFYEETNIPRDAYVILKNVLLSETFRGTNGIMYKHVYYVALVTDDSKIQLDQKFTPMQRREISAIAWKSLNGCRDLTRPHFTERLPMLDTLESILAGFETHDDLST